MKVIVYFFLLLLLASCQYFETQRVSSEEVLQEELQAMDWSDIDTYPSFPVCDGKMEKEDQRQCFQSTILSSIKKKLVLGNWVTSLSLSDTVFIQLEVDTIGQLTIQPIELDSLLRASLPKMDSLLLEGIKTLPEPAPAYKRGIPVRSKFTLPLVINTEEL